MMMIRRIGLLKRPKRCQTLFKSNHHTLIPNLVDSAAVSGQLHRYSYSKHLTPISSTFVLYSSSRHLHCLQSQNNHSILSHQNYFSSKKSFLANYQTLWNHDVPIKCFSSKVFSPTATCMTDQNNNNQRVNPSSSSKSSPVPTAYTVAKIKNDGTVEITSLKLSELLKSSTIHVRDLFSLALPLASNLKINSSSNSSESKDNNTDRMLEDNKYFTSSRRKLRKRRVPSVLLPRKDEIILSFGKVRALVGNTEAILFDADQPQIKLLANQIAQAVKYTETINDNISTDEQYQETFELMVVEEILHDVCNTFHRRLRIYQPILDHLLSKASKAEEIFADDSAVLQTLEPIKESILLFELTVKSALSCLTHVLENDEDMLGLLLTEKAEAAKRGQVLSMSKHENVELLIEEYARQCGSILLEVDYLLKRVEDKKNLIEISLDAYRNRLIRVDVLISMASLGTVCTALVGSFFGMNLVHGFEDSPHAFYTVVLSSSALGSAITFACYRYMRGETMKERAKRKLFEIQTLVGALTDMSGLDYALKCMVEKDSRFDRSKFTSKVKEYTKGSKKEEELNMLFDMLDVTKDGYLYTDDFRFDPISNDRISRSS